MVEITVKGEVTSEVELDVDLIEEISVLNVRDFDELWAFMATERSKRQMGYGYAGVQDFERIHDALRLLRAGDAAKALYELEAACAPAADPVATEAKYRKWQKVRDARRAADAAPGRGEQLCA
jgi:hypothetical protein